MHRFYRASILPLLVRIQLDAVDECPNKALLLKVSHLIIQFIKQFQRLIDILIEANILLTSVSKYLLYTNNFKIYSIGLS